MRRLIAVLTAALVLLAAPAALAVPDPPLKGTRLCDRVYVNKTGARLEKLRVVGGTCTRARAVVARISRLGVVDGGRFICTTYRRYTRGATYRCGLNLVTVQFFRAAGVKRAKWDAPRR